MSSILSLDCPRHHSHITGHAADVWERGSEHGPDPSTLTSMLSATMKSSLIPCLLAGTLISSAPAADHTSTWNGTAGTWSDTTKWSTPGAPRTFPNNGAATYGAIQTHGSLTVDVPEGITIQKFSIGRGTLTATNNPNLNELLTLSTPVPQVSNETLFTALKGAGVIRATGGVNWSAADSLGRASIREISGANTALVNGRTQATDVIQVTGGMTLHGPGVKSLNRRAMNHGDGVNPGTVTWSEGRFSFSNNATFTNKPAAVFDNSFNGDLRNLTGTNYLINEGTFIKSGGTGNTTYHYRILFINSGTLNVRTGTFLASGGYLQKGGEPLLNGGGAAVDGNVTAFTIQGGAVRGSGTLQGPLAVGGGSVEPGINATETTSALTIASPAPRPPVPSCSASTRSEPSKLHRIAGPSPAVSASRCA